MAYFFYRTFLEKMVVEYENHDVIIFANMFIMESTMEPVLQNTAFWTTVPATVKNSGKTFKVVRIGANAFKKSKATKVVIKNKNLKKATVKNSLKGSKVKKIQIKVTL